MSCVSKRPLIPSLNETYYWDSSAEYFSPWVNRVTQPSQVQESGFGLAETLEDLEVDTREVVTAPADFQVPESQIATVECAQMIVREEGIALNALLRHTDIYVTTAEISETSSRIRGWWIISFRVADHPGLGPSMTTSAFTGTNPLGSQPRRDEYFGLLAAIDHACVLSCEQRLGRSSALDCAAAKVVDADGAAGRRSFSFTLKSEIDLFREVSLMFDLVTAHDFYAMLVEDFDDFMAEPHSARRAVHCAITAYHLLDWVWHRSDRFSGGASHTIRRRVFEGVCRLGEIADRNG